MLKLQFRDRRREAVWLVDSTFTIGRAPQNSLMIDDASLQEVHAEIRSGTDGITLQNRAGGTSMWVNGIPVADKTTLKVGDQITLGHLDLELIDPKAATEFANAPASKPSGRGWSIHSKASWLEQNRFPIEGKVVIGRDSACDIALPLEHLSRRHVELDIRGGQLFLKDLDSSNGTFLNGERVSESPVKPGDKIKLDVVTFEVSGPEHDPHKTIIRTAPASGSKSKQKSSASTPKTTAQRPSPAKAKTAPASKAASPKKLVASGKQDWLQNQEETPNEPKKNRTGAALLLVSAILAVGAIVLVAMAL